LLTVIPEMDSIASWPANDMLISPLLPSRRPSFRPASSRLERLLSSRTDARPPVGIDVVK